MSPVRADTFDRVPVPLVTTGSLSNSHSGPPPCDQLNRDSDSPSDRSTLPRYGRGRQSVQGCAEQIILRGIGAEQNGPLLELTVGEDESGSDGVLDPEAEGHALDREEPHVPVGRAQQLERSLCP